MGGRVDRVFVQYWESVNRRVLHCGGDVRIGEGINFRMLNDEILHPSEVFLNLNGMTVHQHIPDRLIGHRGKLNVVPHLLEVRCCLLLGHVASKSLEPRRCRKVQERKAYRLGLTLGRLAW